MLKRILESITLLILLALYSVFGQDTIRVATYNLLKYPGSDYPQRNSFFRTVCKTMNPDILVVQELESAFGLNNFLSQILNVYQDTGYSAVPFYDGFDTDNGCFYRKSKVNFIGARYLSPGGASRLIAEYTFRLVHSLEVIRVYSVHLKAGSTSTDSLRRCQEATYLRNQLNSLSAGSKFIVAGDFNTYTSQECAIQQLISSQSNNIGRLRDPINSLGNWNNNYYFRYVHTQSTRTRSFGDGATGGLDDRFDIMFISDQTMVPHYRVGSYKAYGNDGQHFNDSINRLPNYAVPDSVANALHYASDHLPVYAEFIFFPTTNVNIINEQPERFYLYQNYPNPFNSETSINFEIKVSCYVNLKVFDMLGREIAILVNDVKTPGVYSVKWDAKDLPSGVYWYRLETKYYRENRKMILVN